MKRALLILAVVIVYILHQDFWLWRKSEPLLFGVLPPGLWYHAAFTIVVTILMCLLVRFAWPTELEREAESENPTEGRPR